MSGYIGNIPVPQATQTRDRFVATASQTTFNTSGYTPNYLDVFLNGVHLDSTDYTATDGSTIVLGVGATADDVIEVVAYTTFEISGDVNNNAIATQSLTVDRQSTDGVIVDLQKDGTTVGSIGVHTNKALLTSPTGSNTVALGSTFGDGSSAGLYMFHSTNSIIPFKSSDNTLPDGVQSLGHSSYRWKNLYLSGGVYLGGTGSANYLDDYEEGTWSPTLTPETSGSYTSYYRALGYYTKVGNLVSIRTYITIASGGASSPIGSFVALSLPFSVSNTAGAASVTTLGNKATRGSYIVNGASGIALYIDASTIVWGGAGNDVMVMATYQTA